MRRGLPEYEAAYPVDGGTPEAAGVAGHVDMVLAFISRREMEAVSSKLPFHKMRSMSPGVSLSSEGPERERGRSVGDGNRWG